MKYYTDIYNNEIICFKIENSKKYYKRLYYYGISSYDSDQWIETDYWPSVYFKQITKEQYENYLLKIL